MHLKKSPFSIQDETAKDLDNVTDYPNHKDLMRDRNISTDEVIAVHYRRDLDSLG